MKESFKNQKGKSEPSAAPVVDSNDISETPETPETFETSEASETSEISRSSEPSGASEQAIREAERRGYLKGRNERIEELMQMPLQEAVADDRRRQKANDAPSLTETEISPDDLMILRRLRKSCWED